MLDTSTGPAKAPRGRDPSAERLLEELAKRLKMQNADTVLLAISKDIEKVVTDIQKSEPNWMKENFGTASDMRETLKNLKNSTKERIEELTKKTAFKEKAKKEGWGSWIKNKIKSSVKSWATIQTALVTTLLVGTAAAGAAGYYYWPELKPQLAEWIRKLIGFNVDIKKPEVPTAVKPEVPGGSPEMQPPSITNPGDTGSVKSILIPRVPSPSDIPPPPKI